MVMKVIVDEFIAGNDDLQPLIHEYISAQAKVQVITNPSGDLESGGLGEAKFNVDETSFNESWGRPQRDGPALRAITLATYAEWLIVSCSNRVRILSDEDVKLIEPRTG